MDVYENNGLVTYEHASIDSIPTGLGNHTTYADIMNFWASLKADIDPTRTPEEQFNIAA